MRKLISGIVIAGLALLVPTTFLLEPYFLNNQQIAWATLVICSLGVMIVAICMNIKKQVDDNPYYIAMLKAKREQVRHIRELAKHR